MDTIEQMIQKKAYGHSLCGGHNRPVYPGAFSGGDHQSSGSATGPLPGAARAGDLATDWPDCYVSHCAAGLAGDLAQRAGAHPAAVSQLSL